jgi:hypothetical protein
MDRSIWRREILPFVGVIALLIALAALADVVLHQYRLVWVGRYLGIPGTILILLSFLYSLRKRKRITTGNPAALLRLHELFTWLGALMILIHAGIHFYAILPWLALGAMLVNVFSGLTGKLLLDRSRRHVDARREALVRGGRTPEEAEREMFWDAVAFDLMKRWRVVHIPITLAFAVLSLAHIVSILLFWRWV